MGWANFLQGFIVVGSGVLVLYFLLLILVSIWCKEPFQKTVKYFLISCVAFIILFEFDCYSNDRLANAPWKGENRPTAVEKIVALNDNNLLSGHYYIHRGYVNQDLWYQYMVQLNDGGFVANKLSSKDTTLYYSNSNYRVEWYTRKRHWLWLSQEENYHKIFIPHGSVSDEYSVDLK